MSAGRLPFRLQVPEEAVKFRIAALLIIRRHRQGPPVLRYCRRCGCTDDDCRGCVARTGAPCGWVARDLCSACVPPGSRRR